MVLKEILFCQGDKKELEAITGEKYEYVNPRNLDRKNKFRFLTTVIENEECYVAQTPYGNPDFTGEMDETEEILRTFMVGKGESAKSAIGNLYVQAHNLKTDGLIHVSSPTRIVKEYSDKQEVSWIVYGTPLRKKRKQIK